MGTRSAAAAGNWLIAAAAVAGLAVSIFNYLQPDGIGGIGGALLVIASSALILAASAVRALLTQPWLQISIGVLLFLGIIGTGLAAYMLEAWLLLALMALAMIGWLIHVFASEPLTRRPANIHGAH